MTAYCRFWLYDKAFMLLTEFQANFWAASLSWPSQMQMCSCFRRILPSTTLCGWHNRSICSQRLRSEFYSGRMDFLPFSPIPSNGCHCFLLRSNIDSMRPLLTQRRVSHISPGLVLMGSRLFFLTFRLVLSQFNHKIVSKTSTLLYPLSTPPS
jgi:hypothetical protein